MNIEYKNIKINYIVKGKGETIVLLHGFLETIEMWKNLIPKLSKTHQVIAIDLLGHGQTDCLGYVHTMEDMAEAVFKVLKHHNIKRANFVGHSMGGYVTLAMAKKEPRIFEGLCLMNSTFEADDDEKKQLRTRANELAKTNLKNLICMSFANLFALESKQKFKDAYNDALKIALQTPVQGYIAASEGMKLRLNHFEVFRNLKANKLIIISKKDSLIDRKQLIKQIKGTDIKYVEFSEGHMSHIENESELTYNLMHFVEKLST